MPSPESASRFRTRRYEAGFSTPRGSRDPPWLPPFFPERATIVASVRVLATYVSYVDQRVTQVGHVHYEFGKLIPKKENPFQKRKAQSGGDGVQVSAHGVREVRGPEVPTCRYVCRYAYPPRTRQL